MCVRVSIVSAKLLDEDPAMEILIVLKDILNGGKSKGFDVFLLLLLPSVEKIPSSRNDF